MDTKEKDYSSKLNEAIELQYLTKYDEAVTILKDLIGEMPHDFMPFALIGNTFYIQKKYEEAIPYFEKVLELNPKSEGASSGIFYCLNRLSRGDDALNEMNRF